MSSIDSPYHREQSITGNASLDKNTDLLTAIIAAPATLTLPLAVDCRGDKAEKIVINDTTSVSTLSFTAAGSDTIVGITGSGAGDGAVLVSDGYSKWRIVRGSSGVGATVSEAELVLADNTTGNATSSVHGYMPKLTPGVATANAPVTLGPSKNLDVLALPVSGLKISTAGAEVAVDPSAAEFNVLKSAVAGTVVASKAMVVDAQKAVDTLRATGDRNLGGTGVPGAAAVQTEITKAVTAFTDTTAKDVFTVTVPNAAHAALIELDLLGILGAGGAIGAGESVKLAKYQVVLARTAGVAVVPAISSAIGGVGAKVAGADDITSVVATLSAITGAVGASNSFTIKVAITRSGAGATNHSLIATARLLNQNATGVTIA